jgi:hypothetical protein
MNPGAMEEGGKVAVSVIEALRSQPLMLVLDGRACDPQIGIAGIPTTQW